MPSSSVTSVPSSPFDPAIGLKVRLYNASHSACVAVGHVVSDATAEAALRHWQSSARLQGLSGRRQSVVVKISEAKVPSAFFQYAKSPPSPEGNGSRRCTIGQAAPKIAFPKHGATTGGGGKKVGDESPEVAECGEFEGMVLWDLDHMRDADSYKPPLHRVVDDGGVEYTDNFSLDNLPMGKVVQGRDVIDSVDVAEDDGVEDEEPLDLDSSVDDVEAVASSTATGAASGDSALPGAASNPPTSSKKPAAASSLPVRLDPFHGITRVTKWVPKGHGAFFLLCALLRDAIFMVNQADIKAAERVLQNEGKSAADIQNMKAKDWGFFLKNARRRVPAPEVLLARFDAVISACKDIRDAKTGQVLLSPAAMKAVGLLREHIRLGCFSDPVGVPLYFERGKTSTGLTRFRCVRGTNSTEGYHRYLKTLLAAFCASPEVCHTVLMEFNHRWNISRAVENRGMAAEIGGFSHQYMIDHIQRATAEWYPDQPLFSGWVAPADFEDSGERAGLAASVLTFDGKPAGADVEDSFSPEPSDGGATSTDMNGSVDHRLHALQLLPSARHLASLMRFSTPVTPVSTPAEKEKFRNEIFQYFRPGGGSSSRDHQRIDFSKMVVDWNRWCQRIESGQEEYAPINRKTTGHLQNYYKQFTSSANFFNTLGPVHGPIGRLTASLRQPDDAVGSIRSPQMPAPNRGVGGLLTASAAVADAAMAAMRAAAREGGAGSGQGVVVGGSSEEGGDPVERSPISAGSGSGAAGAAGAARAALPQFRACTECGHHKGAYRAEHPGNRRGHKAKGSAPQPDVEPAKKCSVDQSLRRPESDKVWNPKQRKRTFLPCPCDVCKGSYAHVEDGVG
ncbi:unnamed protein product [Ectocarpus sp. CCAP 1310/34]|nr:unnamed protein product [Ectocarpus sp. CCAP 1310/34]